MSGDENHSWGAGGIFGQGAADALEVLEEMEIGPFPDGMGGFRQKPGLGNRIGAEDAIARRREARARRDSMLVAERFVDELPDLRDKLLDSFGQDGLRGKLREWALSRLTTPFDLYQPEMTIRGALVTRVKEASFEVTAEIFRRAYARDLRRAQAAVRLGAFEPHQWAYERAQKALTVPSTVVKTIMEQTRSLVARARHVANAMSEPLEDPAQTIEPKPEGPTEEA